MTTAELQELEEIKGLIAKGQQFGVLTHGEIATADAIVGDFVQELKRTGVYDRAIIFVLSDHGEGLRDHGELQLAEK